MAPLDVLPDELVLVAAELLLAALLDCEPTFATLVELEALDEPVLSIAPKARALKPDVPLLPLPLPPASSALGALGAVMLDVLVLFLAAERAASAEVISPAPR